MSTKQREVSVEFVGGKLCGHTEKIQIPINANEQTIELSDEDEVYSAKKFHGKWVLFYSGSVKKEG